MRSAKKVKKPIAKGDAKADQALFVVKAKGKDGIGFADRLTFYETIQSC
jgi:hypothetical protein